MLTELSSEILCHIAKGLDFQQDRYHLPVSCRRLYDVLLPSLFSHIRLCETRRMHSIRQVSQFLYAIVRNPTLANSVRVLELGCWETRKDDSETDFEYDEAVIQTLLDESTCSEEEKTQWEQDVKFGITDAWLALLIPRLRALRKINLTWPFSRDRLYVSKMLVRAVSGEGPGFPHLDEAFGSWYDTENGANTTLMHPFLEFPAVRKLGGFSLEENVHDSGQSRPCSSISSRITDIEGQMRHTACVGYDDFNPRALYQSLLLHKNSLERIWLGSDEEPLSDDNPWMRSFVDFSVLKTLKVSIKGIAFLDNEDEPTRQLTNVFPPSLENLYLWECDRELFGWAIEQLESLIDSEHLPKLTTLNFELPKMEDPDDQQKLEQLGRQCEDAGIAFNADDWVYWPFFPSFFPG
ncbi:hypothetical protein FE257_002396 [Aspergillus nanangensis]|uniref:F-box domain-containing protein n=1 Tax=Aspergillus nanangensis TaxID=2582783 RepID=A0AAD4GQ42_ASPNN|nr:hypothetical protein FE257_002396 [Aspergillus nanangensis]